MEPAGHGGQCVIFRGRDEVLDRWVALKSPRDQVALTPEAAGALRAEGRILALVGEHPCVAAVYGWHEHEGRHYLAMEWIDGETLAQKIARGPLSTDDSVRWGRQVAEALQAAHALRVVHADIKPANVMITRAGQVKVIDFGIARRWAAPPDTNATTDPDVSAGNAATTVVDPPTTVPLLGMAGTPNYMPPEAWLRGGTIDHRADIWAFGCLLYECLVGSVLFAGASLERIRDLILARDADLRKLPAKLPARIRDLIARCLVRFRDQRLSDIAQAVSVLETPGPSRPAAKPRAGGGRPAPLSHLPARLTTFFDRQVERREIPRRLRRQRVVTLTGPGGCGKTRQAVEVATAMRRSYAHGAWFAELAHVESPDRVAQTIVDLLPPGAVPASVPGGFGGVGGAGAMGDIAGPADETRNVGDLPPPPDTCEILLSRLREASLLLVLDNCEHVRDAAAEVCARIVNNCPGVHVLVTSRVPLGIAGEQVVRLSPLPVPEAVALGAVAKIDAVRLFVDRARRAMPGFRLQEANADEVLKICRELDGLPLAIELAAPLVAAVPLPHILERLRALDDPRRPGKGHGLPHHRSLRACIRWSYDELTPTEQTILRRMSVFRGGCSLQAVEAVCSQGDPSVSRTQTLSALVSLTSNCLVYYDPATGRYALLETVRSFAQEELSSGEAADLRRRHLEHFVKVADQHLQEVLSALQTRALRDLLVEEENLRFALDALGMPGVDPILILRLSIDLERFWYIKGRLTEGRRRLRAALDAAPGADDRLRARAWNAYGMLAWAQCDYADAARAYDHSLKIWEQLGATRQAATLRNNVGLLLMDLGRYEQSEVELSRAARDFTRLDDQSSLAGVHHHQALLALKLGRPARALPLARRSLKRFRTDGDARRVAATLNTLGEISQARGRDAAALPFFLESLEIKHGLGDRRGMARTLLRLGTVAAGAGQSALATHLLAKSDQIRAELGTPVAPADAAECVRYLRELRDRLGVRRFAAAWAKGQGMADEFALQSARRVRGAPRSPGHRFGSQTMGKMKTNSSKQVVVSAQAVAPPKVALGGGDPGTVVVNPPVVTAGGSVDVYVVYNGNTHSGEVFTVTYINGSALFNPPTSSTAHGKPLSDHFTLLTKKTVSTPTTVIVTVNGNTPGLGTTASAFFVVNPIGVTAVAARAAAPAGPAIPLGGGGDPGTVTAMKPTIKGGEAAQIHVEYNPEMASPGEQFGIEYDDPGHVLGDKAPKISTVRSDGGTRLFDDFDVPTKPGSSGILTILVLHTFRTMSVKVVVQ